MRRLIIILSLMPLLFVGCEEQLDQELEILAKSPDQNLVLSPFQSYDNPFKLNGEIDRNAVERPLKLRSSGTITVIPCKGMGKGQGPNHDAGGGHNDGQHHDAEEGHDDGEHHDAEDGHDDGEHHDSEGGKCKGQHNGEGNHEGRYRVFIEGSGNGTHLGRFSVEITYCSDGVNPLTDILGVQTAANGDQLFMILVGAGEEPGLGTYQDYLYYDGTGRFENAKGSIRMYGFVDAVNQVWELEGEGTLIY